MKRPDKKRGPPATGMRTGPRARALQERQFSDPYQRADRPARPADAGSRPPPRSAVVTLESDVARVFRNSEAVNEALRLVLRLARLASGPPKFDRDRPPGRPGAGRAGYDGRSAGPRRPAGRGESPPRQGLAPRTPKFDDSE